jgi:excisionase family DNA binding protein
MMSSDDKLIQSPRSDQTSPDCSNSMGHLPIAKTFSRSSAPPRLAFTVNETAEILSVSPKTIRRLISRRLLRASRALRHLRISKTEIERFLHETAS